MGRGLCSKSAFSQRGSGEDECKFLNLRAEERHIQDFFGAHQRFLLLDFDGDHVPLTEYPEASRPQEELLEILKRLSQDPGTELVLISGQERENLQDWFGSLK